MKLKALCMLVLLAALTNAYSDFSFGALVDVKEDGTAHVVEKTIFVFDSTEERQAFEFNLNLGQSTITEWQKFSRNIKFHFTGPVTNQRITARREFSLGTSYASISVEYDIGSSIMLQAKEGSRTTKYVLDNSRIAFDLTRTGETILGNNMQVTFALPKDAVILQAAPEREANTPKNEVLWRGPVARKWDLTYEREIALSEEVTIFFADLYLKLSAFLPLVLLVAFSALLIFILVKFRKPEKTAKSEKKK